MMDYCEEAPRYRKKAKKKTPKKANHKHVWEDVILQEQLSFAYYDGISYSSGRRCILCGRLGIGFDSPEPVTVSEWRQIPGKTGNHCFLKPEYQNLPIIRVRSVFDMNKEGGICDDCL